MTIQKAITKLMDLNILSLPQIVCLNEAGQISALYDLMLLIKNKTGISYVIKNDLILIRLREDMKERSLTDKIYVDNLWALAKIEVILEFCLKSTIQVEQLESIIKFHN